MKETEVRMKDSHGKRWGKGAIEGGGRIITKFNDPRQ